ncbi:MAG TPA: malto-oligosyltrehalose synthase [Gammaproteobacteria bacterium]|nr:malto-oligosyltrehalose synthase [Gammaproteobacteria bacterium]
MSASEDEDTLALRAAALGIDAGFHDVRGEWHAASADTLRALIACLGATADTAAAPWPAAIVRRRAALDAPLRVRLPADRRLDGLHLEVGHEDGSTARHPAPLRRAADGLELALALPPLPLGYHRLALCEGERRLAETTLIVTPERCHLPAALAGESRLWGPAVQLYALRSARNWGIGDFTDLGNLLEQWAAHGAGLVGLSPLHALFIDEPARASPYSPSSRLFLNPLYLDVERIEDLRDCAAAKARLAAPEFQARLAALRAEDYVDYAAVATLKLELLALLHAAFRTRSVADEPRAQDFARFRAEAGIELRRHALWEALREHFAATGLHDWRGWPADYRDPESPAVAAFLAAHGERVEFFEYLQWQCDRQLAEIAARARALGLPIGLYGDLAVSVDRSGSETWSHPQAYALDASIGAPPDDFSLEGQDWGLPPPIPAQLRASGYAPFIALLRRCMRHFGALRIDHVMGLMRLYWIPPGAGARAGTYVRYPLADLLGILALESERHRCVVVGEDLGTVPEEIRAALDAQGVLSYRLLYFERAADGGFRAPAEYPAQALVAAGTHDLPTLAGYWEGRDLALRAALGLFPTDEIRQQQILARADARARLLLRLEDEGLLPPGATADPQTLPRMVPVLARALYALLARTPSKLLLVQLEDVPGLREQANLPGTVAEHPNWRRKIDPPLEDWPGDERYVALCATLRAERGAGTQSAGAGEASGALVVPRATYRLQMNGEFTFAAAIALVPYLARLGVSHVYCSPLLRARPGSTHGYDIVGHDALNPEIGSAEDFAAFVARLREHDMGLVVDVVPNHMGVMGADNAWWLDVLEHGPASLYADWFDIDWRAPAEDGAGRVLLPVLGEHYGSVLERGALRLALDAEAGTLSFWYHQHRLPLDPRSYPEVLERALRLAPPRSLRPASAEAIGELVAALSALPSRDTPEAAARAARRRDAAALQRRLAALLREDAGYARGMALALAGYNGGNGESAGAGRYDALHALLEAQAYRLAHWRVAADEINYRRFFDVNELAGLRMEAPAAFESTHRHLLDVVAQGAIEGLRIDHPDGLYDPAGYFARLQAEVAARRGGAPHAKLPLYVVAEKILAPHESLPRAWAVHGTTGYDFANLVNGLFVDTAARSRFERCYRSFVGDARDWDETVYQSKREVIETLLASELAVLGARLLRLAREDRHTRDFTANGLRQALVEVVACFPVYRSYVRDRPSAADRRYIEWAIGCARRRARAADASVFEFLRRVLLVEPAATAPEGIAERMRAFVGRFQQYTAPVCAKGVEDTAFYRHVSLVSLNEVGGGSGVFGTPVARFHRANAQRLRDWPHALLATSTHDTKRAEDVRVRIDVLSELPGVWRLALRRWARLNRSRKRQVHGRPAPSRKDEYLLYQTLLGSFPPGELDETALAAYRDRIQRYMQKAAREAKTETSWMNVDQAYEDALSAFVEGLLARREGNLFLDDFLPLQRRVAAIGRLNGLAQTLLKLTAPGVPDLYRGTEIEDFSLVDPDNRRPLDYAGLAAMLEACATRAPGSPPGDLSAKLCVTQSLLRLRRRDAALFRDGDYLPLATSGEHADRLCAYARRHAGAQLVVVVPRLLHALVAEDAAGPAPAIWGDTAVLLDPASPLEYEDAITRLALRATRDADGTRLRAAELFAQFPVAALWAGESPS